MTNPWRCKYLACFITAEHEHSSAASGIDWKVELDATPDYKAEVVRLHAVIAQVLQEIDVNQAGVTMTWVGFELLQTEARTQIK